MQAPFTVKTICVPFTALSTVSASTATSRIASTVTSPQFSEALASSSELTAATRQVMGPGTKLFASTTSSSLVVYCVFPKSTSLLRLHSTAYARIGSAV